ncbi:hypothetical protein OC861_005762 [Tilletia horrida]|nr:hypothetical protein OC861_005762 [Tilletia horrida]
MKLVPNPLSSHLHGPEFPGQSKVQASTRGLPHTIEPPPPPRSAAAMESASSAASSPALNSAAYPRNGTSDATASPRRSGRKQSMFKSASATRMLQSRRRRDSGSSNTNIQDLFYSSSAALASAGRERDAGRDQYGNRWHAHGFPTRVESLCDITALEALVDDRGGKYEEYGLDEERVKEHVRAAPKKVRAALQEYYDSQLEILEGWREADEILESSFPKEVLRRFGTDQDVQRFTARSRFSQLHLNRLVGGPAGGDSDSDTGYDEDEEDDDEEDYARRGSIARAASALSGFWFNTSSGNKSKRKREISGTSNDDVEENAALLGRDGTSGQPTRGRRAYSRNSASVPYGATNFSSQPPSTTPIAEHQPEELGKARDQQDLRPAVGRRVSRSRSPFTTGADSETRNKSVAEGHVDPHSRKDSPSGRVVAVESEASAKGGPGKASKDGSLDRKLAQERERKERDLHSREAAVKKAKEQDKAGARAVIENDTQLSSITTDDDDDDGHESDGIRLKLDRSSSGSSTAVRGLVPMTHSTSSNTIRETAANGGHGSKFKSDPAGEGTNKASASGISLTHDSGKAADGARPTLGSSSSSSSNTNKKDDSKWPFRTAVDTLQERERRLLLESVPGKMEKASELERGTQFAININLAINILLIGGKGLAVVTSNSVSLIASFVDSVLDLLSTVIIFITSKAISYRSSHTVWKYPVGKKRFEPLGVLVESINRLMTVIRTGNPEGENPAELPTLGIVFMVITIVVKTLMWLLYRNSPSSGVRALAQDAQNDVVFNVASLLFPVVGSLLHAPAFDPIGGIILSLYIIKEWLETLGQTVTRLSGAVAEKEHLAKALYLVTRFRRVLFVSTFELYYSGDEVIAEADVVLPLNTPLKEAHDVCEVVTYCLEVLDIERAYVHLDYHIHNPAGHLTQRG